MAGNLSPQFATISFEEVGFDGESMIEFACHRKTTNGEEMAEQKKEAKGPAPKPGKAAPPPLRRGGRRSFVHPEVLDYMKRELPGGDYESDGIEYESKNAASTAVMRVKKALINDPDTAYSEGKELRTRVWQTNPEAVDANGEPTDAARFAWALAVRS